MNNAYPALYREFLDFLDVVGLAPCTAAEDAPCFEFPHLEKNTDPSVVDKLHEAYTELVENLDREVVVRREHGGAVAQRLVNQFQALRKRYPELTRREYEEYYKRLSGRAI